MNNFASLAWASALRACQTRPKVFFRDKGAVPLTFSEMPCMTTSKSCGKSLLSASRSEKAFFFSSPLLSKGSKSDKPRRGRDVLASQTSDAHAPLSLHANLVGVTPPSARLSAPSRDYKIQRADSHLNNCFQMSSLISRSHYLLFCALWRRAPGLLGFLSG